MSDITSSLRRAVVVVGIAGIAFIAYSQGKNFAPKSGGILLYEIVYALACISVGTFAAVIVFYSICDAISLLAAQSSITSRLLFDVWTEHKGNVALPDRTSSSMRWRDIAFWINPLPVIASYAVLMATPAVAPGNTVMALVYTAIFYPIAVAAIPTAAYALIHYVSIFFFHRSFPRKGAFILVSCVINTFYLIAVYALTLYWRFG